MTRVLAHRTEQQLREEWHYCAQRIDSLHDEAWAIQTSEHERMTEIWLQVQRHRARIAQIVATGITFEAAQESPE